jgi:transposase
LILPPHPLIYVALRPTDLRCGIDKLAAIVTGQFAKAVRDGALFLFLNKAKNRLRILFYDRTGAWLLHKRLDRGIFPLPLALQPGQSHVAVSTDELRLLLDGLDTGRAKRVRAPPLH